MLSRWSWAALFLLLLALAGLCGAAAGQKYKSDGGDEFWAYITSDPKNMILPGGTILLFIMAVVAGSMAIRAK